MNQMYGFDGEVTSKYSSTMASLFTEVFNQLPLAHCIEKRVLVRMRRMDVGRRDWWQIERANEKAKGIERWVVRGVER